MAAAAEATLGRAEAGKTAERRGTGGAAPGGAPGAGRAGL